MGSHPINLAIRFILELSALLSAGIWGWNLQEERWLQFLLAIGVPLVMAAIWGVFAVPGDPSRSGKTVVETPGFVRLFIELAFFSFACWALLELEYTILSLVMGILVILHYLFSLDRIKWLLTL